MKKTAIIFDHDGTLVDSLEAVVVCTNLALAESGCPEFSAEEIINGIALSTKKRFMMHTGFTDEIKLKKLSYDLYRAMHSEGIKYLKVYPGIPAILDSLTEAGFSMGMVSNNQGTFIRKAAARLEYSYDLEVILGEENIPAPKPDPSGLLQACAGLGAVPENSWYIGDSETDYLSARAAGMKSGLVTWGAQSEKRLTECGADAIFRTPGELGGFFLNTPH